jgi:hypothetical protein
MEYYSRHGENKMNRRMTRTTARKLTLFVAPKRRLLWLKIRALAGKRKKSISEQVWDLCELGLDKQTGISVRRTMVALPGADLGQVFNFDRKELYRDILADRRFRS